MILEFLPSTILELILLTFFFKTANTLRGISLVHRSSLWILFRL